MKQVPIINEQLDRLNVLVSAIAGGNAGSADLAYKKLVAQATTKSEVDSLFIEWWKSQYDSSKYTKVEMLERWFGNVLDDDRVHGVDFPLYATSESAIGTLTDDSAGLACTPSTEAKANRDDFAHLPQFWCLEVSAEKKEDGSHDIYYVEHIDNIDDVRSGEHLTWVLQKNTYTKEWNENGYRHFRMRSHSAPGYNMWIEGTDRTGHTYAYMAHPKYLAGKGPNGITCGTGLEPYNWTSHTSGVAEWRKRGKQYAGASGADAKFLLRMMWLKYARKGNSGTIEGCTGYSLQYLVAASETGVERVLLTPAQAANLLVGSACQLGIQSGSDRNTASNYSIFRNKRITKIEEVEISGTTYAAVYFDNGGTTFDTTEGSTYLSTDPYWSGWNDSVQGNDGSRYSATSGKEPGLLQKIEFMNGAYEIFADELGQWSRDEDGTYRFTLYACHDQTKISGTAITSDYKKVGELTFPSTQGSGWINIKDTAITDDHAVLWTGELGASGTGIGVKAAFYCSPAASGVRASWCFGNLDLGGYAGLPCRSSVTSAGIASWHGALGSPALAG